MKVTQMHPPPPEHAANLMANSDNTAYGVDVIISAVKVYNCILNYGILFIWDIDTPTDAKRALVRAMAESS